MFHRATRLTGHVLWIWYSHKWFLLVCLGLTAAYGVASVVKEVECYEYLGPNGVPSTYFEHGWPMEYVSRYADWETGETRGSRWRIYSGVHEFKYRPFLTNLSVALGLSLFLTHLWFFHCARHKPWQFSLRELLAAMLLVSLVPGVYLKHRSDFDRESAYLAELYEMGWALYPDRYGLPWYYRPLRDLGIAHEEDWALQQLSWTYRERDPDAKNINEILSVLSSRPLSYVESVVIGDSELSDRGVMSLCEWAQNCSDLHVDNLNGPDDARDTGLSDREVAYIANRLPHLRRLAIWGAQITDEGVRSMATMRRLESLSIEDTWCRTTNPGLRPLVDLPRLEWLRIPDHWRIDDATDQEAARRGIEIVFGYE